MFNDRDLGVLGAGALLAVLCLLLPFSFGIKVALGLAVLVAFIVLALLRLGPDRTPLEVWLVRRIRFQLGVRRYTYQQPARKESVPQRARRPKKKQSPPQRASQEKPGPSLQTNPFATSPPPGNFTPVALAVEEVGVYPLVTVLLAVVGVDTLFWLAQGGGTELALLIGGMLR